MEVTKITNDNFEEEVLKSTVPVILDFGQTGADRVKCSHRSLKKLPRRWVTV